MTSPENLSLDVLRKAVAGDGVAIRSIVRLESAGGPGDKVFPPTYLKEKRAETKYAFEDRQVNGEIVSTVLLDSVASQANRIEESLLEARRRDLLKFPLVRVSFSDVEGLEDLETISTLQAPHRIADALLRDSLLDGKPFRYSEPGKAITDADPKDATAMYRYCPTALVFGVWDSTGPKGGLGAKFQRALVSEIVGYNAVAGVKTASRLDPTGIEKKAGTVYEHTDPEQAWTLDKDQAVTKKGKPVEYSGASEGKGQPSNVNHGNIPPTIDREAGGITLEYALQTTVLSLPALRRLRFRTTVSGDVIPPGEAREHAEIAARTLLAALALSGIAHQRAEGYDLRSRSLLVPSAEPEYEIVSRIGKRDKYHLDPAVGDALVDQAGRAASEHGLAWDIDTIDLAPAPKLVQLIKSSRDIVRVEGAEEGG